MRDRVLFSCIFLYRLINAWLVTSYFDPDEYWQCLEVAHQQVFGYGFETWDWKARLRNWVFVLPFIAVFRVIRTLGIDGNSRIFVMAPRILQALLAALLDFCTHKFAKRTFARQPEIADYTLSMSLVSMFNMSYITRTLSNSMEASITALALCFWPIGSLLSCKRYAIAISLVGLTCLIRPSAAVNWIFPGMYLIASIGVAERIHVVLITVLAAVLTIACGALVDTHFYGDSDWVFTWWNFFEINLAQNISLLFGSLPWHFYLTQAVPLMAFTMLPLVALGVWYGPKGWMLGFVLSSIWFNSLAEHKEFRFLYPIIPVLMTMAGLGRHVLGRAFKGGQMLKRLYLGFVFISSIGAGLYLIRWHHPAPITSIDWLRSEVDSRPDSSLSVVFLMPCHSAPFYGYLHRDIPLQILSCSPPVDALTHKVIVPPGFIDEADQFYANPPAHLRSNPQLLRGKTHVYLFEDLTQTWPDVAPILASWGFKPMKRFFNGHWHPDKRRRGDLVAYSTLEN